MGILDEDVARVREATDIVALIDASGLSPRVKEHSKAIFKAIGEAEARVHHKSLETIHFHEVGAIDSIVDIIGAAIGFDLLGVDQVVSSPIPTGRGQVLIAHGVCAVPTPGTAELLKGSAGHLRLEQASIVIVDPKIGDLGRLIVHLAIVAASTRASDTSR